MIEDRIKTYESELVAIRRDLHEHPELALEEVRTSEIVAKKLTEWGYQVHRGLAKTGVVATLSNGGGNRTIGIRADMDALPIHEETGKAYASRTAGKMHACGHDGHTTMLLGAARYLAETKSFSGTVHLIFQPAEEDIGGARIMVEEGIFKTFPCDAVFALHNEPGTPVGKLGFRKGRMMAAVDQVQISLTGKGGHGADPHNTVDPIVAGASLVMALQTIVARNVDPLDPAVVTVGCLRAGAVCNVIPETAFMDIGIRFFDKKTGAVIRRRIEDLAKGQMASFGGRADLTWVRGYPPVVNHDAETDIARAAAVELTGEDNVFDVQKPYLGSEDFSFMLEERPGSYLMIGNGDSAGLHNPKYDFNDKALVPGAAYWSKLVEHYLRPDA
ncbi:MAG: M20 aminoacylase family protein [Hyphomicrobiaceae bacterium]